MTEMEKHENAIPEKTHLTGSCGDNELFWVDLSAENLHYVLWYNFMDASDRHYARMDCEIDKWSREQVIDACGEIVMDAAESLGVTPFEFMEMHTFPESVQDAIEDVKNWLQEHLADMGPEIIHDLEDSKEQLERLTRFCSKKNSKDAILQAVAELQHAIDVVRKDYLPQENSR